MKRSTRECAKSSICFKADLFSTTHNHTIIRCNQRVAKTKTRQSSLNKTDLKKNAVAKRRTSEHLQNKNIERKKKWKIFPECKFSTIDHKFFLNNPLMFWHSNKKRKHRYHFQPSLKTRFDNTMPPPLFFFPFNMHTLTVEIISPSWFHSKFPVSGIRPPTQQQSTDRRHLTKNAFRSICRTSSLNRHKKLDNVRRIQRNTSIWQFRTSAICIRRIPHNLRIISQGNLQK